MSHLERWWLTSPVVPGVRDEVGVPLVMLEFERPASRPLPHHDLNGARKPGLEVRQLVGVPDWAVHRFQHLRPPGSALISRAVGGAPVSWVMTLLKWNASLSREAPGSHALAGTNPVPRTWTSWNNVAVHVAPVRGPVRA